MYIYISHSDRYHQFKYFPNTVPFSDIFTIFLFTGIYVKRVAYTANL